MATTTEIRIDHEMLTEALELLDQAREALQASGIMSDPRFRAYCAASIEGSEGGWLGGPFLIDEVRSTLEGLDEDGEYDWQGRDDD